VPADKDITQLLLSLLQGFYWFDEGLQNYLRARGWPAVTRPQSMVMANIVQGICHPSDIARRLGISRQAIHATLGQMVDLNMIALIDDPDSGRSKLVTLTRMGEEMRRDAQAAMQVMADELGRRIGAEDLLQTAHVLSRDWGPAMSFGESAGGKEE
jgi:DNA-binding MarR family transcriptional regulator